MYFVVALYFSEYIILKRILPRNKSLAKGLCMIIKYGNN